MAEDDCCCAELEEEEVEVEVEMAVGCARACGVGEASEEAEACCGGTDEGAKPAPGVRLLPWAIAACVCGACCGGGALAEL